MALIQDIYEANVNGFLQEMNKRIAALSRHAEVTRLGGDYRETYEAYVAVLKAAHRAAELRAEVGALHPNGHHTRPTTADKEPL